MKCYFQTSPSTLNHNQENSNCLFFKTATSRIISLLRTSTPYCPMCVSRRMCGCCCPLLYWSCFSRRLAWIPLFARHEWFLFLVFSLYEAGECIWLLWRRSDPHSSRYFHCHAAPIPAMAELINYNKKIAGHDCYQILPKRSYKQPRFLL